MMNVINRIKHSISDREHFIVSKIRVDSFKVSPNDVFNAPYANDKIEVENSFGKVGLCTENVDFGESQDSLG